MSDRLVAADAWRRAAAAADVARLAFERLASLEAEGASWLAIARAATDAVVATDAAAAAFGAAVGDGGPAESDLLGEVDHAK